MTTGHTQITFSWDPNIVSAEISPSGGLHSGPVVEQQTTMRTSSRQTRAVGFREKVLK